MQRDINTVTLTGRLTKEPKLYQAGKAVYALLRVAVHAGKSKDGKDLPTIYYDVKVWNGSGKSCARFLKTGSRVAVEGRLAQYVPNDGKEWNHIHAISVGFVDQKEEIATDGVADRFAGGDREVDPQAIAA
jgi:single-stranded DNA-binding protein